MKSNYPSFGTFWILGGLTLALLMGFNTAAHMSFVLAFGFPIGESFRPVAQLHGHVQLLGWTAFFIAGVSVYFLPRQASAAVGDKRRFQRLVWWLLLGGVLCRIAAHSAFPFTKPLGLHRYFTSLAFVGSCLELVAVLLLLRFYWEVFRKRVPSQSTTLTPLFPFLGLMAAGLFIYVSLQVWLTFWLLETDGRVLDHKLCQLANNVFLLWVLFPVCFAFSLRLLPLYLRLPYATWWKSWMGFVYVVLALLSTLGEEFNWPFVHHSAALGRSVFFFAFVFGLDVLTRWRRPWTEAKKDIEPSERKRQPRKKYPDYGEFGHFEWYIYTAYASLLLGALLEATNSFFFYTRGVPLFAWDVVRHIYFLGFVAFLIFGVGVRMLPGLAGKKALRWPWLSDITFGILFLAFIGRVAHFLLFVLFDLDIVWVRYLFGLSGILGMVAVLLFLINMAGTFRKSWKGKLT